MKKRQTRHYSYRRKMNVLAKLKENGDNRTLTAKQTHIPSSTIGRWVHEAELREAAGLPKVEPPPEPKVDSSALDDQLEQLARQMVAVMPEKVEEANLQELARTLAIVLSTMNEARAGKERTSHAHEKLAEILERYATGSPEGIPEPADGG